MCDSIWSYAHLVTLREGKYGITRRADLMHLTGASPCVGVVKSGRARA